MNVMVGKMPVRIIEKKYFHRRYVITRCYVGLCVSFNCQAPRMSNSMHTIQTGQNPQLMRGVAPLVGVIERDSMVSLSLGACTSIFPLGDMMAVMPVLLQANT